MTKLTGSILDRETPKDIVVTRLLGAAVLSLCSLLFYSLIFV